MSIQKIFDISKQSLLQNQSAINTTAKNIANVNSEIYKRRKVDISQATLGYSGINSGTNRMDTVRVQNLFIESQLLYEKHDLGKHESDEVIFQQVENIFGEPSDFGLSASLTEFWNSWSALANDPESQTVRSVVRSKGDALARAFNRLDDDLVRLQKNIRSQFEEKVSETNQLINQLGELNRRIIKQPSNDLLDQRDGLLHKLAPLININVREHSNRTVTVSTSGHLLVSNDLANTLSADITRNTNNGNYTLSLKMEDNQRTIRPQSGGLLSLIDSHNSALKNTRDQLDALAVNLAVRVNALHESGYNLDNQTGNSFFDSEVTGAGDLTLSQDITDDPSLIATSNAIDVPGDGSIAQRIADVQYIEMIGGNSAQEYYSTLVSDVGKQVRESSFLKESQEKLVHNLKNQRDAISGVSIDEEMTRLIEFEQSYQAAARIVTVVEDLSRTIINLV